jgi:hypothetical protein
MKKTLAIVLALGVLSLGAVASAHMWGGGPGWGGQGWGGGPGACGGPGWGGGPSACGGPGWGATPGWDGPAWGAQSEEAKKFFEATVDLRKKLHEKMFEYREAYRTGDEKKAETLDREIDELRAQLYAKAKETGFTGGWGGPRRGFGPRSAGYGPGACRGPGWGGGRY